MSVYDPPGIATGAPGMRARLECKDESMRYSLLIVLFSALAVPSAAMAQTDNGMDLPDPAPAVSNHIENRGRTVLENLPELTEILQDTLGPDGPNEPAEEPNLSLSVATSGARALGGFRSGGLWGKAKLSRAETSGSRDDQHLVALGAHSQVSDRLFLGGLVLFDRTETEMEGDASGAINGSGWMAGPYFAARNGVSPLYFEGRLLYGRSSNEVLEYKSQISSGSCNGSFDSRRWLAQARVEGEYPIGNGTVLIPLADFSHIREHSGEYADRNINMCQPLPGQRVDTNKLQLGAKFSIPVNSGEGTLKIRPGFRFVMINANSPHSDDADAGVDSHGRIDFGVDYRLEERTSLSFNSYYSGIGRSDFELYGAGINLRMRF